ncbi:coiled-coil-helix-coiled-coil-helix domain-containing protein 2-like [Choloepus didactylus]|uniref:coiled-coil-helix-coiled-coil-helix domain-containing protein 2-like n=1 Tax=Choloepus didactylus TaxID=27675 RepID=UPI00189F3BBF|nr:coiled-coil-helix-coiled-coil-helix domain-containing protein 2-like [Choloepus didactylus]
MVVVMSLGSQSCTLCMAPLASWVPQMRATPRLVPAAQGPAAASPSAVGSLAAAPQHPGQITQIAVVVGSAVGCMLGHAVTGGVSSGSDAEPPRPDITYQEPQGAQPVYHHQQQQFGPCCYEMKQFLEGAQNQRDLKLCEYFSKVQKQYRFANVLA